MLFASSEIKFTSYYLYYIVTIYSIQQFKLPVSRRLAMSNTNYLVHHTLFPLIQDTFTPFT